MCHEKKEEEKNNAFHDIYKHGVLSSQRILTFPQMTDLYAENKEEKAIVNRLSISKSIIEKQGKSRLLS